MEWVFTITFDRRILRLRAKLINSDSFYELIQVSGSNRSIVLQSNRPMLLNKGLRHRKVYWKLKEGVVHNPYVLDLIIKNVEDYLRVYG